MSLRRLIAVLPLLCTTIGYAAEHSELTTEQMRVLEAVRKSTLQYVKNLPDFICTQTTHRTVSGIATFGTGFTAPASGRSVFNPTGGLGDASDSSDVIEERLTYFDQHEKYEVIAVNGRRARNYDHMQFEGAMTAGEFGSALENIFDPRSQTSFRWDRKGSIGGHPVYVFKFGVPKEHGVVVIHRSSNQEIMASYSGQIFVDSKLSQILKITSQLDLPADFPIKSGSTTVEYRSIEIAEKKYNLPYHSEVRLQDGSHLYVNEINFRNYHKFAVESTIHFDSEDQSQKQ